MMEAVMGRLIRILDKDGVTWAVDADTKQIKKLTMQVVSPSQVDPDVVQALADIVTTGKIPDEGLRDPDDRN
jgi:hypothetical protein